MLPVLKMLDRPISFHRILVTLTGSVTAAVMLGQAVYWSERTSDPDGWFYKTQEQWEEETGLTRREQETARKRLRELGFWYEERRGVPARLYFKIDPNQLEKLLEGLPNKIGGKRQTGMAESAKQDATKAPNFLITQKITSEITSENTNMRARRAPPARDNDIATVFAHWCEVMEEPSAKLSSDRRRCIAARLKEEYTVAQLIKAIDGCSHTGWNMGQSESASGQVHNDLTLICRGGALVERFCANEDQYQEVRQWTKFI